MRRYRHTKIVRHAKIVATVGPASSAPKMLRSLFPAGVDTFRLDFSHGVQEDHVRVHAAIRALNGRWGARSAFCRIPQGPKIQVGTLAGGRLDRVAGERTPYQAPNVSDIRIRSARVLAPSF